MKTEVKTEDVTSEIDIKPLQKPIVPTARITVPKSITTGKLAGRSTGLQINSVSAPNRPMGPPPPSSSSTPGAASGNVTEVKVGNRKMKLVQNFHATRPFRGNQGSITRLNGPMKINSPRPNGPQNSSFEGKTVIGTKTVGGQQQQITMDNAALQRNFNRNINPTSIGQTVRITNPPANLVVTSKMVGGKEVQLVTPNIGPKTKGTIRFVRPSPVGGSGPGVKSTVTISNSLAMKSFRATTPTSSTAGGGQTGPTASPFHKPFPKPFNSMHQTGSINHSPRLALPSSQQQMIHQTQPKLPVNVRTAVGGANKEKLPKPPNATNAKPGSGKGAGIIKLGALTKNAKDQPTKEPAKEEEDVSTRQLAEKFLNSGSSRKINKKLTDVIKPTINKATERLLDNAKTDSEKPSPKTEEKKKNKGIPYVVFINKIFFSNMINLLHYKLTNFKLSDLKI